MFFPFSGLSKCVSAVSEIEYPYNANLLGSKIISLFYVA